MRRFLFLSSFWLLVLVGVMAVTRRQEPLPQWIYFERSNQLHRVRWDGSQEDALPIANIVHNGLAPDGRWVWTGKPFENTSVLRRTDALENKISIDTTIGYPLWTPDSRSFIIATSDTRLSRYDVATGTLTWIPVPAHVFSLIGLSPDGQWLLFNGFRGENITEQGMFAMHLRTKEFYEYDNRVGMWNPQFSPDGEWIAFSDIASGDVFKMRVDGSDLQNLTNTSEIIERFLWWDGAWLYFTRGQDVMRMRPDGTDVQRFKDLSFYPPPVSYGDWIIYTSHEIIGDMALTQMFRYNHTTDKTVQLTNGPTDNFPRIIPPTDLNWHPPLLAISAFLLFAEAALIRHFQRRPQEN